MSACLPAGRDEVAHHTEVRRTPKAQLCRFSRSRQKGIYLTEGGLLGYEFSHKEKSAEVIVSGATRCHQTANGLTNREGPNVNFFEIRLGIGLSDSLFIK